MKTPFDINTVNKVFSREKARVALQYMTAQEIDEIQTIINEVASSPYVCVEVCAYIKNINTGESFDNGQLKLETSDELVCIIDAAHDFVMANPEWEIKLTVSKFSKSHYVPDVFFEKIGDKEYMIEGGYFTEDESEFINAIYIPE